MVVRAAVAALVVIALLSVLGARLWYLQVVRYEGLAAQADQNRIAVLPLPPRRGEVFDRNGEVLARNYRDYILTVTTAYARRDLEALLDELSEVVYISARDKKRFFTTAAQSRLSRPLLLSNNAHEIYA